MYQELLLDVLSFFDLVMRNHNNRTVRLPPQLVTGYNPSPPTATQSNGIFEMSYNDIPAGKDLPNDINVIIEIPANHDPIKYEVDKDSDAIFVDRFVATPMFYPANYGYVPQTLSEDGDPLDVLVVTPYPVMPGAVIRSRLVGVLNMSDESGVDAKLLAVPHSKLTKIYDHVQEATDLPELLIAQIGHYFENYKALEPGKWVKVEGWDNADAARAEVMYNTSNFI